MRISIDIVLGKMVREICGSNARTLNHPSAGTRPIWKASPGSVQKSRQGLPSTCDAQRRSPDQVTGIAMLYVVVTKAS